MADRGFLQRCFESGKMQLRNILIGNNRASGLRRNAADQFACARHKSCADQNGVATLSKIYPDFGVLQGAYAFCGPGLRHNGGMAVLWRPGRARRRAQQALETCDYRSEEHTSELQS